MRSAAAEAISPFAMDRKVLGGLLFLGIFLFFWISLNPFVDLTLQASASIATDNSNKLNQILFLCLPLASVAMAMATPMRGKLLQPLALTVPIFLWFLLASLVSNHTLNSLKALILSYLVVLGANCCLLLPRSQVHFAKLIAIGTGAVLLLCYYGLYFLPHFSIHSAAEVMEPMHAGLWRGYFPHKNNAASAMVLLAFCGIFVMRAWSKWTGLVLLAGSVWFLLHTGGKTASAMLPAILLLAFIFERFAWLRTAIAFGGVLLVNVVAVGAAVSPGLTSFITSLGVDATFTNRADIWRLAMNAVSEFPLTGYGLKSFWRTEELVYGGTGIETWAVQAAHSHNGYVEILLSVGFPGLILSLIWFLAVPLRAFNRLEKAGPPSHAARLFLRIWLYLLFVSTLESLFFESASGYNLAWFMFALALFGLRYEADAQQVRERPREACAS
ncbi:O-antigen ligase family protein [Pseudorhizobium flavum]|uniref:O-antigen ligase family protein n=1 Tax=Pseudorhizobium flavum TaxID=1335061 RepID=UPI002493186C|nr:O-antigen ligase [Pseudorhizobium flavum]